MRLLLVNYELPPIGGGGGRATLRLGREFVTLGHEVAILTSAFGDLPRDEEAGGARIRRIPVWRPRADRCPPQHMATFVASGLWFGPRFAREVSPDLVFAFFGIPSGPVALRIKRAAGAPYALSLRGSDVPRPELGHQRVLEALVRPVLRRVWRNADALISVGEGLAQAALTIEPGLDIKVIPNGVDLERFRPGARGGGEEFRLLFVGRLREFKGVQHVLDALASSPEFRGARLDVVGDGAFRPNLERRATQSGLGGRVRFLGWLAPEEMPERYRAADALVLPSYAEGCPNVLLEAMASGLPVIASDAPGCREIVTHGREGLLVPAGDAGAIAEAAARLAGDAALRQRMGAAALERAREFSWRRVAERHLDIFQRVLEARR